MGRRVLISLVLLLVIGGAYVWFSLTPAEQVNLEAAADVTAITDRLEAARSAHLPVSLSGSEVKALAVKAIKAAKIDDRIKGIDVELGQNSMTVALAVDIGSKVVAVSAEASPVLSADQLTIDLESTRVGAVPVPMAEVMKRFGDALPSGVTLKDGRLTIDLSSSAFDNMQLDSLAIENGALKLQAK